MMIRLTLQMIPSGAYAMPCTTGSTMISPPLISRLVLCSGTNRLGPIARICLDTVMMLAQRAAWITRILPSGQGPTLRTETGEKHSDATGGILSKTLGVPKGVETDFGGCWPRGTSLHISWGIPIVTAVGWSKGTGLVGTRSAPITRGALDSEVMRGFGR